MLRSRFRVFQLKRRALFLVRCDVSSCWECEVGKGYLIPHAFSFPNKCVLNVMFPHGALAKGVLGRRNSLGDQIVCTRDVT
jgi:hypothetical protein